jgi:glycosyltransferase involved in cell wall biosynthesis
MDQGSSVKRIVFFTHQNPQGYRIQQYFPFFEDGGFNVELLTSRMNFLKVIDRIRGADVLYIQRLLFNPLKLSLIKAAAKRIVYDFDDAVMHGSRGESATRARKFKNMVKHVDAVLCGNRFLLHEAKQHRDDSIYYVPTVVDSDEYPVKEHIEKKPVTVGWIGSRSTLRYLVDLEELVLKTPDEKRVIFKIVADKSLHTDAPNVIFEKWTAEREKSLLLSFDIGVMPLRDDVWSRGKCGLKLIQYMASGLPSITHPIGAAQEIINDGVNGMLRSDMDGWKDAMDELSGDVKQRARMGQAARQVVEERYSLKVWGPKVREIIEGL